jgi:hypothetical protein
MGRAHSPGKHAIGFPSEETALALGLALSLRSTFRKELPAL